MNIFKCERGRLAEARDSSLARKVQSGVIFSWQKGRRKRRPPHLRSKLRRSFLLRPPGVRLTRVAKAAGARGRATRRTSWSRRHPGWRCWSGGRGPAWRRRRGRGPSRRGSRVGAKHPRSLRSRLSWPSSWPSGPAGPSLWRRFRTAGGEMTRCDVGTARERPCSSGRLFCQPPPPPCAAAYVGRQTILTARRRRKDKDAGGAAC